MLDDNGNTVGTAFQQNVRPTGTERNKADMAASAAEQISALRGIVKNRPDIFGPVAGRKTDFDVWAGSQDPDAQRFRAARTIAGDHLAGTFGGRSEAALAEIDKAIGQFHDNPAAVDAGLDQLGKANNRFLQAGTVRTNGSKAAENTRNGSSGDATTVIAPNGKTYHFKDAATATQFRTEAGLKNGNSSHQLLPPGAEAWGRELRCACGEAWGHRCSQPTPNHHFTPCPRPCRADDPSDTPRISSTGCMTWWRTRL